MERYQDLLLMVTHQVLLVKAVQKALGVAHQEVQQEAKMKISLNQNNNLNVFTDVYGEGKKSALDLSGNLYMDVNALILSPEEHNKILKAQNLIVNLLKDMLRIVRISPELLEWLGVPSNLWEDSIKEKISNITSYGRFDWMFDKDGALKLLEFNSETPFGFKEAIDYHNNLYNYFSEFQNGNSKMGILLQKSVYKSLYEQNFTPIDRIAIIGDLMDEEEYETYDVLKREINYNAQNVFTDSIVNLKALNNEIYLEREDSLFPIDFLQTFYSAEWMAYDEGHEDFVNALNNNSLKLINPTSTLILHSKGLFALIWFLYLEENILEDHSETIKNYIPYTSFLETEFIHERKFVAKPLHHREGNGVEIRTRVSYKEDDNLIYQKYIDSVELLYPLADKDFNRKNELLKPTIGTYLIDEQFAGYYSRLSKEICGAHFSVFTPTFIDKY